MSRIQQIKQWQAQGWSLSAIAAQWGVDRKTVRKYVEQQDFSPQIPVLVGVSLDEQGYPQYGFLEKVANLTQDTVTQRLPEQVEPQSTWRTDGAEVYAKAATVLKATLEITRSTDPQAAEVFHGVNVFISNAQTFLDGTYHGRGRARRPLYFAEFVYRFNRRHFGFRLPERLLLACGSAHPHPDGM